MRHPFVAICAAAALLASCSSDSSNPVRPQPGSAIWSWGGALAQGQTMWDVWMAPGGDAIAVGDNVVLRRTAGTWVIDKSAPQAPFRSVWGTAANQIVAVGRLGTIYAYDGTAWTAQTSPVSSELKAVFGLAANNIYAVGEFGVVLNFDGTTWSQLTITPTPAATFYDVWANAADDVYVAGTSGIYHYDGANWNPTPVGNLRSIWGTSANNILAGDIQGNVWTFDGNTWTDEQVAPFRIVQDLWGVPNEMYAATLGFVFRHNGTSWEVTDAKTNENVYGVWGEPGGPTVSVGSSGLLLETDATSWSSPAEGFASALYSVWGAAPDDVYAVGNFGAILHYDGSGWETRDSGTENALYSVWGVDENSIYAAGDGGTVLHYNGGTWSDISHGSSGFRGVWARSTNDVYAVGSPTIVAHYDGVMWNDVPNDSLETTEGLEGVWGNDDKLFVVGFNGLLIEHDGSQWQQLKSPGQTFLYRDVFGTASGNVYFVGEGLSTPPPPGPGPTSGEIQHGGGIIIKYDGSLLANQAPGLIQQDILDVWGQSDDLLFAVGDLGNLWTFSGGEWTQAMSVASMTNSCIENVWGFSASRAVAVGQRGAILMYARP